MEEHFSIELKNIIAESRYIAIDLGYDYISSVHFFLANCKLNDKCSIRSFAFDVEAAYERFYKSLRVGDTTVFAESLPLTLEAEKTIRKAIKLRSYYHDSKVRPHHVFLAASQITQSSFYAILEPADKLHESLVNYYIRNGQLFGNSNNKNSLKRLLAKLFK